MKRERSRASEQERQRAWESWWDERKERDEEREREEWKTKGEIYTTQKYMWKDAYCTAQHNNIIITSTI